MAEAEVAGSPVCLKTELHLWNPWSERHTAPYRSDWDKVFDIYHSYNTHRKHALHDTILESAKLALNFHTALKKQNIFIISLIVCTTKQLANVRMRLII